MRAVLFLFVVFFFAVVGCFAFLFFFRTIYVSFFLLFFLLFAFFWGGEPRGTRQLGRARARLVPVPYANESHANEPHANEPHANVVKHSKTQ